MDRNKAMSISSDESGGEPQHDRRSILDPVVRQVVDALGGRESGAYRLGDQVLGCLKDLKKLWRKDDTDDERTVARIFWDTGVMANDLVPILLATAGQGLVEDKRAIACADLMTAMTWPIDLAEELKELDEELDKGTDYTQLTFSHLNYKAALLKPGVIQALMGLLLPPLAQPQGARKERDKQVINVVLYLFRNLAFIKDLPANSQLSADHVQYSTMQAKLIQSFSENRVLDLLLTIATNASTDPFLNGWNTLVLEIFYLLFRGVKPSSMALNQAKAPSHNLNRLLAAEASARRDLAKMTASRHSRFGTTISVTLNPNKPKGNGDTAAAAAPSQKIVVHRQQAVNLEIGDIIDMTKKQKSKKGNKLDELTTEDNLSVEARSLLQHVVKEFLQSSFNSFISSLLKDIRSERPKITEKDNLRLLYVTKWFLEFFLCMRAQEGHAKWPFSLVAEVVERGWIIWVLKRMRQAVEDKPRLWTELQAGIECLTQLLLLIEAMSSSSDTESAEVEAADVLRQQLVYNGEVLDIALESLRSYKEGTQTLAYLHSSVAMAHALMKMLERWGMRKPEEMYVRRKKARRKRKTKGANGEDEDAIPDVEEVEPSEDEDVVHETIFTFEAFEMKFAHSDITRTLLTYLAGHKDFTSPEQMKRVVSLLHRQAVKAKAEGLFFNVSTLHLFKSILDDQKVFPKDQPYKDLIGLVNFILRQFFKALEKEPFLAIEAFFPKNRSQWKQYSSWEPEAKLGRGKRGGEDVDASSEMQVKKGFSETEQIGIVMAALAEKGQSDLINWVVDILTMVMAKRRQIVEQIDAAQDEDEVDDEEIARRLRGPSQEAISKFEDFRIPCVREEQAIAATRGVELKLLFRLCNFKVRVPDADEFEWYVPAAILPIDLQSTLGVIRQYLASPYNTQDKKASTLLKKATRRRRKRSSSQDSNAEDDENARNKSRKEKRRKEKEEYKSAALIVDSDEEYGDMDVFLEKEKALREKTERVALEGGRLPTMKSAGTKKRRSAVAGSSIEKKRRKRVSDVDSGDETVGSDDDTLGPSRLLSAPSSDPTPLSLESEQAKSKPRPRPKLVYKASNSKPPPQEGRQEWEVEDKEDDNFPQVTKLKNRRLVISDDDE